MQRLKTRKQFQAVLAGERIAATAHFALHRCALDSVAAGSGLAAANSHSNALLFAPADVWLGAMVPKRWAKRAVTRNTIKRQIHIVSFKFESALPTAAHLVRLRAGFDRARFFSASSVALKAAVREEVEQLFAKALQDANVSHSTGLSRW